MSRRRILALATRIIRQFRRDHRTLALLFVVPVLVMSLVGWIYRGSESTTRLAVVNTGTSALAGEIIESLREDARVELLEQSAEDANENLTAGDIDAVLHLPEDLALTPGAAPPPIRVTIEGSDPGTAGRVLNALNRAVPQAIVQTVNPAGEPLQIEAEFLHGGPEYDELDYFAPTAIGFFAFFFVFLLTSVSFLRERMQGSIERLMVSPLQRGEIVIGYMLGFSFFAALQSLVLVLFSVYALGIHYAGSIWLVFFFSLLLTLGAVNLGIFLSTFARSELQVVQFIPLVITPQALLSGIIWQISSLPLLLQWLAHLMPLTYANQALRGVMIRGAGFGDLWLETAVLTGFAVLMIALGSSTLRREIV